jgi:hypothetical protein
VTGNAAAWIILLAVVSAVVIAVLAGLWVSWRRERRQGYTPAHKIRRRPPPGGPGRRDLPGPPHRPSDEMDVQARPANRAPRGCDEESGAAR